MERNGKLIEEFRAIRAVSRQRLVKDFTDFNSPERKSTARYSSPCGRKVEELVKGG